MAKSLRFIALCMALCLLLGAMPAHAAVFHSDVRVKLSIGSETTFTFTPVGEYTLREDEDVKVGNDEITITAVGGRVSVTLDGKTITAASLTFESENYGETTDYIRLKNAKYSTCTYLGHMTFDVSGGSIRAINKLPIEQYLYGVVPNEMSNSFPLEALKAQAVCARGYAVSKCSKNVKSAYDLGDTSSDQVYEGYASKNKRAIAAVDGTKGQVLTYDGEIIEAYYSASNGGQTERTGNVWENDLPYYVNADDPYDLMNASSIEELAFIPKVYNDTTRSFMDFEVLAELERQAYLAVGQEVELVSTVSVIPKEPAHDEPSRCYTKADVTLQVRYTTEEGEAVEGQLTVTLVLEELEFGSFNNTLGKLKASKTRLRMMGAERGTYSFLGEEYEGWNLTLRRYGHGVGLSQRSAQERARAGQKYDEIVAFYYVGTTLNTVGSYEDAPELDSDSYRIRSTGISDISLGTTAEKLLSRVDVDSGGTLSVITRKGAAKEGELATGDFLRTAYDEGKTFFDLPIIIFGDINGDGKISEDDASALQAHLHRGGLLNGAYLKAADVNHDDEVNSEDMIRLIQYLNDDARISQGG